MSNELATTTGLTEWKPDVGRLPDGWRVVEIRLNADVTSWRHRRSEAEITLRYDPYHPGSYHEVRLRLVPSSPTPSEWLTLFLEAMMKVPWPTYADIEYPGLRYP